tara:strand:+ start:13 stop:270 length:258 start_codon:yes stop_codon:yes gene_type:complete
MKEKKYTAKEVIIDQLQLLATERGISYESLRNIEEDRFVIWIMDNDEYLRVPIEYLLEIPFLIKLIQSYGAQIVRIDNKGNFVEI